MRMDEFNINLKDALGSYRFESIIRSLDELQSVDIVETFFEKYNINDHVSLKKHVALAKDLENFALHFFEYYIRNNFISSETTLNDFLNKFEDIQQTLLVRTELIQFRREIFEEIEQKKKTSPRKSKEDEFQNKPKTKVFIFYDANLENFPTTKSRIDQFLKIIDDCNYSTTDLSNKEMKEISSLLEDNPKTPLFLLFDDNINNMLFEEKYNNQNKSKISLFYRKIYQEFLETLTNHRFFLFTLKQFNEYRQSQSSFKHDWLLIQARTLDKDSYPFEPLELPKNDNDFQAIEKIKEFLINDYVRICNLQNSS